MNQAKSCRLRMRYLLLLAPLLVAGTPSPQPLAPTATLGQLAFVDPPLELKPGTCVPITVQVQNLAGLPVNLGVSVLVLLSQSPILGTYYGLAGCQTEIDRVLIPDTATSAVVWFRPTTLGRMSLVASDGVLGLLTGTSGPISVVPGLTSRLEFTGVPVRAPLGAPVPIVVTAFDEFGQVAQGYGGKVRLSSNLPVPGLPLEATFEPLTEAGQKTFTLTFPEPGDYRLTVEDVANTDLHRESPSIQVLLPKVVVFASPQDQAPTCGPVRFDLSVVDEQGNPVQEPATVSFCRPELRMASIVSHSFGTKTPAGDCVIGTFRGTATVVWTSSEQEEVPFTFSGVRAEGDLSMIWRNALSPLESSFSFPEDSRLIPTLVSFNAQLKLQLELRDTCGRPFVFPPDKILAFAADAPLFVSAPKLEAPGLWTASVGLTDCPADLTKQLAVWPTFNGTALNRASGEPFERRIQPQCSEPLVELSIRSKEEGTLAEPGGMVELEVKIENKGQTPIMNGVLQLEAAGLTLVKAEVDGEPLTLQGQSAVLPVLDPNKTLTVRVTAQTTTQLDQEVSVTAWYTTPEGAPLTPEKAVTFNLGDLGVNVGCGCQAASLPSQLLSWVALLLAASRPWERSRRLRRRERIDR